MADKIGDGYIEITAKTDAFNAAMAESKARVAELTRQRAVLQVAPQYAAGGAGFGLGRGVGSVVQGGKGIFGAGLSAAAAKRYANMPHPTIPGLNALGNPMPVAGSALVNPNQHALYSNRDKQGRFLPGAGKDGGGGIFGMGGTLGLGGMLPAIGAAYVGKKVFDELGDSFRRGSDMIETGQKLKVVFGAATGSVVNMADEMAAKFGNNKAVMLDAASQFGLIGQAAKLSEAESAKMAIAMTKLADDASSFYNVDMATALQKIQAGLVGQSKPLREFGVLINIATVNARAAEMGFKRLNGQFSESEKVMARMSLIKEGLTKAKGDRERTIDSPANTIRQIQGEFENFKTDAGMNLAGAAAGLVRTAREGGVKGLFKEMLVGLNPLNDRLSDDFQAKMDKRMGVDVSPVQVGGESGAQMVRRQQMEKFLSERQAYDQFMSDKYMRENAFKGPGAGFGGFGMMGNLGQMLNRNAMLNGVGTTVEGLDKKIARAERREWGGGHVSDPLSFLRQAQEQILKPQDETQKQQLAELKAIREAVQKSTPDGKPRGAVLRGRES